MVGLTTISAATTEEYITASRRRQFNVSFRWIRTIASFWRTSNCIVQDAAVIIISLKFSNFSFRIGYSHMCFMRRRHILSVNFSRTNKITCYHLFYQSFFLYRSVDDKMSFQEVWRTNLWMKDSFFHEKLERLRFIFYNKEENLVVRWTEEWDGRKYL